MKRKQTAVHKSIFMIAFNIISLFSHVNIARLKITVLHSRWKSVLYKLKIENDYD